MTPDIEHQTEPKSKNAVVGTHRIVAGIDGSAASLGALRWAANEAQRTQATLEVVMAWHWPFAYDITPCCTSRIRSLRAARSSSPPWPRSVRSIPA